MRKRIWQLHSFLGLFAGLGLLLIGLSGSLLVFHDELENLLNPAATRVVPSEGGRLSYDTLLARANTQLPDYEITGWHPSLEKNSRQADALYLIRHGDTEWKTATLDQYTGKILASPVSQHHTLTGWLLKFHYQFFAGEIGRAFCGILALALLALGVSGIFIYRQIWKNLFTLRWSHAARVLFSDFHKLIGITSVAFNLILGFTGAYWNITEVIEHVTGDEHPPQPTFTTRLYPETLSVDALLADAQAGQHIAGFRVNFISLPSVPASPAVIFWGDVPTKNPFRNPYGSTISYDAKTSAFAAARDIRTQPLWAQITDMFQPLHYGTFGGLFIKILWAIGGLTPGALAVTGFVIWRVRSVGLRPTS